MLVIIFSNEVMDPCLQVGFDGVFFARADYQDKEKRLKERSMEFIWRGSKSLGSSAEVKVIKVVFSAFLF